MTIHSLRFVTGMTVLAIVISACAAAPGAQPTAQMIYVTPAPTASAPSGAAEPTATPPATPLAGPSQDELRAAAAKAYRAAVIPVNRKNRALSAYYKNKTSLKALRTLCAKLAANERTFLLAMKAVVWPTDTAGDAKILIRALAAEDADLRTCATAANFAAWNRAWALDEKASVRVHEAANLVRLDLGLQPVPG